MLNRVDALLTLTALSSVADKVVFHLAFLSSLSQSFPYSSGRSLTWHDSCTFVPAGNLRNRFENNLLEMTANAVVYRYH